MNTSFLIEILKHTPAWVFVLFFVLLAVGYFQSKDRAIGRGKVSILPVAMIVLSFHGVLSAFGAIAIGLVSWVLGVVIAVGIGVSLPCQKVSAFPPQPSGFWYRAAGFHWLS